MSPAHSPAGFRKAPFTASDTCSNPGHLSLQTARQRGSEEGAVRAGAGETEKVGACRRQWAAGRPSARSPRSLSDQTGLSQSGRATRSPDGRHTPYLCHTPGRLRRCRWDAGLRLSAQTAGGLVAARRATLPCTLTDVTRSEPSPSALRARGFLSLLKSGLRFINMGEIVKRYHVTGTLQHLKKNSTVYLRAWESITVFHRPYVILPGASLQCAGPCGRTPTE